jgi:class 3 adenylate cyclase
MRCPRCATELLADKAFCHGCGLRARASCPACGALADPGWRFCPNCGSGLAVDSAQRPGEDERRLQQHIPAALAERIRSAGVGRGERKQVTVFFCDLAGSSEIAAGLDPELYRELLDRYLERVFAEIYRVEGIVNQLAGDGLMALFGAPLTHGDDPVRAVRAALGAQQAIGELSQRTLAERGFALRARIGIHTGMVVVGTVGNDLKMDYTAIGDTTNLAARLQELAEPGAIWLSDATERLVRGRFVTEAVGPIQIKGRGEPVGAFRVVGAAPARTHMAIVRERGLTPFVGREAELAQLLDCFRRLGTGAGQLVSLVGDAGSGKSRLVYELKQRIKGEGAGLFEARCSALMQTVPYAPWARMLERHVGVEPGDPPEVINRKLVELLGTSALPTLPYLRRQLGLPAPELGSAPPETARQQAYEAFRQLVRSAARRGPVVMIIEELHWIDDSSLEMLRTAALDLHRGPVMLLVTHRPEYEPPLRTRAAETRLHLVPFGAAEGQAIVRAVAGGDAPPELVRRILAKAEGNPFFIEELTRALLEDGTLAREADGELVATRAVEDIAIPDTVQEVLAARLDRLRASARRVAQIAAVLGREFAREQLARMFEHEWIDPDAELEELERQGILHRKAELSESVYRFGESLTQSVAYETLLLAERRELHGRAARILEAASGKDPARLGMVAHHWARSHERRRGAEALVEAAAVAEDLPAYGNALRLYREAWDLIEELLAEAADADTALLRLALGAARGMGVLSVIHGTSDAAAALRAAERAETLGEKLGDPAALAMIRSVRGMLVMAHVRERYAQGIELLEGAVELAEQHGLERLVVSLVRPLALGYALDGRLADSRRCIELAIERLAAGGEADPPSDTYLGARLFHARILLQADALEAGEALARETYRQAVERTNRTIRSGTAALIAHALFMRGEYTEALEFAREAAEIGAAIGSHGIELTGQALLWGARAARGERQPGPAELTEHGVQAGNLGAEFDLVTEVLLDLGEVEAAGRFARLSQRTAAGGMRDAQSRIALACVQLAQEPPELDAAIESLRDAEAWADRFGSRSTRARALLGLAQAARMRGVAQPAEAGQAAALFDDLGMGRYAERARALAR